MAAKAPILAAVGGGGGRARLLEREAPLGYVLVLPAVLYLALFIAYPFLMSISMSFTDAQAGNRKWTFVGAENYSKVENYQILANDFVIATLPTEAAARELAASRASGRIVTSAAGSRYRANLEAGGMTIPLLEMNKEDDASYLGGILLQFRVVAHASDAPVTFGPYTDRATLQRELKLDILVPARTSVKTNGKGVLQDPNFRRGAYSTTFIEQLLSGARRELIE